MGNEYQRFLMHHGIKGQKWGVRRYQNPDGTLTTLGKARRNAEGKVQGSAVVTSILATEAALATATAAIAVNKLFKQRRAKKRSV